MIPIKSSPLIGGSMMKKKKFMISAALSLLLVTPLIPSHLTAEASSITQQKQQIHSQEQQLHSSVSDLKNQVSAITAKIEDDQVALGKLQNQSDQLKTQITQINDRLDKRKKLLSQRVQAMYINGSSVNYIDVLLGAKNFGDFISRVQALYSITKNDQDLIKKQEADQQKLQAKEQEVQNNLQEQQTKMHDLNALAASLNSKISDKKQQLSQLTNQMASLNAQERANALAAQARAQAQSSSSSHSSSQSQTSRSFEGFTIPAATMSGSISDVISAGEQWIGRSQYVFGGGRNQYTIDHGEFDCSSFVYWAYKQAGISLGSYVPTTTTLRYMGRAVSPNDMQPGDLIFFNTYEIDGHVAIYLGNGKFLGAQSSTGVAIASLNNPYWRAHFNGTVRRIVG